MSIDIITLRNDSGEPVGFSIIVEQEDVKDFKEMVNRAFNCWDTASPELKVFADKITHGKILQNYHAQSKMTSTESSYDKNKDIESEGQRAIK
jgi:hypothetical protein